MTDEKSNTEEKIIVENAAESKPPKKKKDPRDRLYKPEHQLFVLNASPHDFKGTSVPKIMWHVIIALVPATAAALYYFGLPALLLILSCVVACLVTEIAINLLKGQKPTVRDGSAVITGLLLALTLPPTLSITSAVLGSIFAIAVGKQVFGGLGYNIFNPALIGRAFLQASFPVAMTTWQLPFVGFDGISAATPLGQFKFEKISTPLMPLLTGNSGGKSFQI